MAKHGLIKTNKRTVRNAGSLKSFVNQQSRSAGSLGSFARKVLGNKKPKSRFKRAPKRK